MLVIVSSFLMIFLNDLALLLYGEISCRSSLGLNGLRREKSSLGPVIFFLWGDWLSLLHMFKVEYAYSFLLSVVHHESRKIASLSWPLHALSAQDQRVESLMGNLTIQSEPWPIQIVSKNRQDLKNKFIMGCTKLTKLLIYIWLFESLSWS